MSQNGPGHYNTKMNKIFGTVSKNGQYCNVFQSTDNEFCDEWLL